MGTIRSSLLEKYAVGNTFVETGCQEGWTFYTALDFGFEEIYGIELHPDLCYITAQKFIDNENVYVMLGESPDILAKICPELTEPATFWLDAHVSGPDMPGGKYGPCPLLLELEAIKTSPCKDHVILIDDIRLMNTYEWDYLDKQEVINALLDINPNYQITYEDGEEDGTLPNDILIASIKNIG